MVAAAWFGARYVRSTHRAGGGEGVGTELPPAASAPRSGQSLLPLPDPRAATAFGSAATAAIAPSSQSVGAISANVDTIMNDWRSAIISKNADVVERLDLAFASDPPTFAAALMKSARTDSEERVRSFSTRVLGKLKVGQSTELMRDLLSDHSAYVRFNAAWALGELQDHSATPRLRQLQQHDRSPIVRSSAGESLKKLEGS